MPAKRVLMLVENLPVPFDRRVWMEAQTLVEAGMRVSVICPSGQQYRSGHERLQGVDIYRYFLPSLGGIAGHLVEYLIAIPATLVLSLWVAARQGVDVVHAANPPDFFFLVAAPFKLLGRKFIFDHHDLVPEACETRWHGFTLWAMRGACLLAERISFRLADVVVSTNESYRDIAIRRGGKSPTLTFVVRSGPMMTRFQRREADPRLRRGAQFLVAYLGVMGPNDGIDLFLFAIREVVLICGRRDIKFALIGDGDLRPRLEALAKDYGIESHVEFTGRISDDEVLSYLSTADIGVAPDPKDPLNDWSTMNKIVEYMAVGLPVVAFDLHEAHVSAGGAAAYAEPNDPRALAAEILAVLDDPERRRRMAVAGRRRFEQCLAWETQREALLAAYSAVNGADAAGLS